MQKKLKFLCVSGDTIHLQDNREIEQVEEFTNYKLHGWVV